MYVGMFTQYKQKTKISHTRSSDIKHTSELLRK